MFPAMTYAAAGVPIAIGSDSQVRIDPFEEARELETLSRRERELRSGLLAATGDLWRELCRTGYRSLGLSVTCGPRVTWRSTSTTRTCAGIDPGDLQLALVTCASAGAVTARLGSIVGPWYCLHLSASGTAARARWRRRTRWRRSTPRTTSASTSSSSTCGPGTASSCSLTRCCTRGAVATCGCKTRWRTSPSRRFADLGLNVDVKHSGCEQALLDGLRDAGLLERTLISSQVTAVLDRVRALEPRARVGISVGGRVARFSRRWNDWREQVLAGLESRRWDALMAQHRLVDRGLVEEVLRPAWHAVRLDRERAPRDRPAASARRSWRRYRRSPAVRLTPA